MLRGEMQHNKSPAEKIHINTYLLLSTIGIQLSTVSILTDMVKLTPDFNLQMAFLIVKQLKVPHLRIISSSFLSFEDLYTITTCTRGHIFCALCWWTTARRGRCWSENLRYISCTNHLKWLHQAVKNVCVVFCISHSKKPNFKNVWQKGPLKLYGGLFLDFHGSQPGARWLWRKKIK